MKYENISVFFTFPYIMMVVIIEILLHGRQQIVYPTSTATADGLVMQEASALIAIVLR